MRRFARNAKRGPGQVPSSQSAVISAGQRAPAVKAVWALRLRW
jgi:hypothetical protein